jgi:filamentous hemagglutinin family protein
MAVGRLKRCLLLGTSAFALGLCGAVDGFAAPQGGAIVSGNAGVSQLGNTTTIQQSTDRAIIRWNSFDVGASERVDFQQPSRSSITVNRIADAKASLIDGQITANGNILLLNPNGVLFGSGSRVDVGGLVASSADLADDAEFMAGGAVRLGRAGIADARVTNRGQITVGEAGLVGLVAPNVENDGVIHARLGKATLASGDTATLDLAGDGLIQIALSDSATKQLVKNTGTITADGGVVSLTAAEARAQVDSLISNEGTLRADTIGSGKGRVVLNNARGSIQNTGRIQASGAGLSSGGDIVLSAGFISLGGTVVADGADGGSVSIAAGTLSLADDIWARGTTGRGGTVGIDAQNTWETSGANIDVSGDLFGGSIRHIAQQQIISSGKYFANSAHGVGGSIDMSGWSTKLLSANFEANGLTGGGSVCLGGEYQGGKNLALDETPNAHYLIMDGGTHISADAFGADGAGGTAILWSDAETIVMGSISARPGTATGVGGFVEVSSEGTLKFDATTQTGRGTRSGNVLLDPKNILISDFAFNASAIIMGYGYQGGRTNQNTNLDASDYFGNAVSLDGNRMAVGAYSDDGLNNVATDTGAVYLFSFTDSAFSGAVLESVIGRGYTGGKNIDLTLGNSDYFGYSVSLDGDRLAVGAYADDGSANAFGDSGAVYLFSFTDSAFGGGVLESTIGRNYTGGKNVNVAAVANSDYFGWSVALDGNRLAVGASAGDGSGNTVGDSGEVYLFSFTDSVFNGGVLESTIGNAYAGGKNRSVTLGVSDRFGSSISLDGNQLAVGAYADDGFGNARTDSGAVYLFSFTDAAFSGGVLESTMGYGYTGGKNVNLTELDASDDFGWSVSLNSNRLAIGARRDDGYLGATTADYGGVYLYSMADAAFTGLTQQARIGYQYRNGAKDFDLLGLGIGGSDYFGGSVSLDGNRLIVGSHLDDGATNVVSNTGAVYAFTFADSAFSTPTLQGITGSGYLQGKHFNVPTLSDSDNYLGTSVSISGTRLAVGSYLDDGFNSIRANSGAVYLYSFSDTSYSNGTLEAIIGDGYTGGKNVNQSLRINDRFGAAVSLDSNRLAVGSYLDNGLLDNAGDAGAVYLYSFSDAVFSGAALESRIGVGYTGGKNISVANLGGSDQFGLSVALDGNRLAVGAFGDDGSGNALTDSGAVYLFSFTDAAFNGGVQEAIIGRGYTGGKNLDNTFLDASDQFGYSIALEGNQLAVGALLDDGFGNVRTNAGAVYLYTFTDSVFAGGVLQARIGDGYTGGKNISLTLGGDDRFGVSVGLANNNLFVGANLDDAFGNGYTDSGAVYRYSFTDAVFGGGTLGGMIGTRYVGANDYDLRGYQNTYDYFGRSLSVDGQNLVVGVQADDGYANNASDAGGIYFFRYTDTTYQTPQLLGMAGAGYGTSILNKGVQTNNVKDGDYFGWAVALDGNRMAVGAQRDDGLNDVGTDRGAVYLYSFADSAFSGGVLEGIIGQGYTGGKNINLALDNSDYFGSAVSLDGNRLAVGAYTDDGLSNVGADRGAVYLFNFADSVFTSGALTATIGQGYTGGKNINQALDNSDYFGWSVSLDGNRLAVGARLDDGSGNVGADRGAVYLYSFADSAFSGGALTATLGQGYTGGKNVSLTLGNSDYFGSAVSLDGTMLAVGAPNDDGNANAVTDSGAAYFYTFSDSAFTGGALQGIAGYGYTGGKNINVTTLETSDTFGSSVSLNANRLAIGADLDDGFNNQASNSGSASLFTFADSLFTSGTLQSVIGYRYAGGKNYDLANDFVNAAGAERFAAVSLDGNRLLIGGYGDDAGVMGDNGAVAMFAFADSAFTGASHVGITGNGYVGGKNISFSPSVYQAPDYFGWSVALNANRLAVGVPLDDGFGDGLTDSGAVYLYTIPSGDYEGMLLEGIIGSGYIGGKNINMSAYLDRSDYFGAGVSLDGNRLAVSAVYDDGMRNDNGNAGAVYLFNFADSAFSSGTLEARVGYGYTGGKNVNATLGGSDYFGWSVALDGNRLAVGAQRDDGSANTVGDSGAVYLYSFSDSVFSGGALQGTIGYGYTGGKNYNVAGLEASDYFGNGVSLDGNRLAIGAQLDDGFGNLTTNAGAVYLFTFSDAVFTSPTLQSTIGDGYTGGKNYNMAALYNEDRFGSAVALDGTLLTVGAPYDDGLNVDTSAGSGSGAIFLYTFADTAFTSPLLDSTIGNGYTGGKNININLGNPFGTAIGLDSGVLVAGLSAGSDVTNQLSGTGRIYIFRDSLSPVSSGSAYGIDGGSTIGITSASIAGLLSTPQNVTLQASNDITVGSSILVNNGSGNGGILTLQAGRSIFLNAAIDTDDADLNVFANENLATGVVNTQRDAGAAVISMGANGSINAGTGNVTFRIDAGTGKTNLTAGDMTLRNITANTFRALSGTELGNIIANGVITASAAGDAILLDAGANFINNYGAGALSTPAGRWLIYGDHTNYTTLNGLVTDFSSYKCSYGGSCLITIPGTGNGALYQYGANLLTITVNAARAYGDANPVLAALQSLYQYTGFVGMDTVAVLDALPIATIASSASATADAATTHAITLSGGSDNFYEYYFVDGLLTINKKDITAAWSSTLNKAYGDINPTVNTSNFVYTGLANSQNNSVITANGSFGVIDQTTVAGTYAVGASFTATNYNITNSPTTTLTIDKRPITAAWTGPLSRVYGDAEPTVTAANFIFTGLVNGDLGAVFTPTPDFSSVSSTSNVGAYAGIGASFSAANYTISNAPTTTLNIGKRDITASVNNASRAYGDANPSWNWSQVTWGNLANSETGAVLDALTVSAPTAIATSNAGTTHAITLTGFSDNNYNLTTNTSGTLTIDKRLITAAWNGVLNRIYGDSNPAVNTSNFTYTNLANADPNSAVTATADYGTTSVLSNVGSYSVGANFTSGNYIVSNSPTTTLNIGKRDITATVGNDSRAYGDANPSWNWSQVTWGNLANSETGAVLDALTVSAPTAIATSNAGTTHAITLTGFSDNNYNLTTNASGTLTVNQAPLTVLVHDARRSTQMPNPIFTYSLLGLRNGEPASVVSGITLASAAQQASLPGRYSITATGGSALNYIVGSYLDGELIIGNANNIPSTVEAALRGESDSFVEAMVFTGEEGVSSEQPHGMMVVPDDKTIPQGNRFNALIAITERLNAIFGIHGVNPERLESSAI